MHAVRTSAAIILTRFDVGLLVGEEEGFLDGDADGTVGRNVGLFVGDVGRGVG